MRHMRYAKCRHLLAASLLIAGAVCYACSCTATSDQRIQQRSGRPERRRPTKPGVYVRDSAVAAEKLALALRMEHLKEWNKSADVYQEIIEKYADRVVPADAMVEGGDVTRYTSVTLKVQALIGKWPEEGLAVYRGRYEAPAQALLDAADIDDAAALNHIVQRYFLTEAAKKAALRLMELYIENGEFSAAAWLGQRLLLTHPSLAGDEPTVLFRTALAQHMAGNDDAAKTTADDLKQRFATALGTVMGKDVTLADEIVKMIAQPAPVAHGGASESWPTLGGDPSRGRVPNAQGRPGANVASISLLPPKVRRPPAEARRAVDAFQRERRDRGLLLGIMPVIDRGELFYQDNTRIYAVSADSGIPLPGWAMSAPPETRKNPGDQPIVVSGSTQTSVTVTDASALAIVGQWRSRSGCHRFRHDDATRQHAIALCRSRDRRKTMVARAGRISRCTVKPALAQVQRLAAGRRR